MKTNKNTKENKAVSPKTLAPKPELKKLPNKTFILNLTVKQEDIQKEYQEALKSIQSNYEIKGFRKGKVPLNIIQEKTNPSEILEDVASHLISHCYSQKVKELEIKPIIQPKVKLLNQPVSLDKDWQLELKSCELPEIELDPKYIDEVKKINSENKDSHAKLDQILDILVKLTKVDLPEVLIESEIQNKLSQLVDQTSQAGLSVEQYLKSKNLTLEQYQNQIKSQTAKEWTLNLVIDQIAKDQKFEVKPEEVKDFLAKNQNLSSNINLVYYLLIQQKVIQYLENLK